MSKRALFPLEKCIVFNKKHDSWFEPMIFDAAYLHAMAFSAGAFFNLVMGRSNAPRGDGACVHFLKTIRLLRERLLLEDEKPKLTNQTISVILTLAIHARMVGDGTSARNHMAGLSKIISLRGGVGTFGDNPSLLIEILRYVYYFAAH
jgi:hypothetical protein